MSAETNQSSGGPSPLCSPTNSQQSTQTLSSEEEGSEEEGASDKGDPPLSDEEGYLEEDEYLDEETYLKGKEYLCDQEHLKEKEYLQEEKGPEGNDSLAEEEHHERDECLEENLPKGGGAGSPQSPGGKNEPESEATPQPAARPSVPTELQVAPLSQIPPNLNARIPAAGGSQVTAFLTASPPTSESAREPPYYDATPSTSFVKDDGEFRGWQDQGTQTEWLYESKAPGKSKRKAEKESSAPILPTFKSDLEEHIITELQEEEKVSPENFWDGILNEPISMLGAEDVDDNVVSWLLSSSCQSALRTMMEEMAARSEREEDTDVPLTGPLGSEARRKLGLLMKKNFKNYKKAILWLMKKRGRHLAVLILSTKERTFIYEYIVLEDGKNGRVRALINNTGHATVYDENGEICFSETTNFFITRPGLGESQTRLPARLQGPPQQGSPVGGSPEATAWGLYTPEEEQACVPTGGAGPSPEGQGRHLPDATPWSRLSLSQNVGYYFAKGKPQKAWNWWDLSRHVHAPPVQSISLNINRHIKVQIRRQDEITFHFTHQTKHVCLNLGTKYKVRSQLPTPRPAGTEAHLAFPEFPQVIAPEVLSDMKQAAVLEVAVGPTARKMHGLLGEMSKILNFLTVSDLEKFLEATTVLLQNNVGLRKEDDLPG
ncbi:glutamate-rich protein 6B [Hipposideros larvatus]